MGCTMISGGTTHWWVIGCEYCQVLPSTAITNRVGNPSSPPPKTTSFRRMGALSSFTLEILAYTTGRPVSQHRSRRLGHQQLSTGVRLHPSRSPWACLWPVSDAPAPAPSSHYLSPEHLQGLVSPRPLWPLSAVLSTSIYVLQSSILDFTTTASVSGAFELS